MKKLITTLLLLALTIPLCFSKPVTRKNVTINAFHPQAVDRIHCPTCSGITRIYFNREAWGDTSCRTDAGDLYKEDEHILSLLMFAWASGKKVDIEVNNEDTPIDTVCKITAATISE